MPQGWLRSCHFTKPLLDSNGDLPGTKTSVCQFPLAPGTAGLVDTSPEAIIPRNPPQDVDPVGSTDQTWPEEAGVEKFTELFFLPSGTHLLSGPLETKNKSLSTLLINTSFSLPQSSQ